MFNFEILSGLIAQRTEELQDRALNTVIMGAAALTRDDRKELDRQGELYCDVMKEMLLLKNEVKMLNILIDEANVRDNAKLAMN